ncbi:MAG TPA: 3-oxoadipate enol-lactonase [Terriglobales bacterium]|nr:3-oxoadipate enol-lactonase [Terriglobales bacterium]
MPFAKVGETRLFYRLEGNEDLPVLVLSHSIGADQGMWQPQVQDLLPHFRILRYDTLGHGASDAPKSDYSIAHLGRQLIDLLDVLNISKTAFCGLSLGSAIGQWLAINAPERLTKLILASTTARFGTRESWQERMETVRRGGMASIVDMVMRRFFSPGFISNAHAASLRSVVQATDPDGYLGCCAALRDFDLKEQLKKVKTPTLIIVGDRDIATPWAGGAEVVAEEIAGAHVAHLPGAHLSNLESPRSFSAALAAFLRPEFDPASALEEGFEVRRRVLGEPYVDRAISTTTEFTKDFQDLITRYAWGNLWTRPGLDLRTRRLLVLAMMATLGHWEEFRMHIAAGLAHGLEPTDIKEVLLQAAIYAGVPVANTGFRIAQEEMQKKI